MGAKARKHLRGLPRVAGQRREWDRCTELLGLFAMTGHIVPLAATKSEKKDTRPRPQSILLVGAPGSGKTELLMRYHNRNNKGLIFRSDLTVRGLWRLLTLAQKGRVTHVITPEFNKLFQRKVATAMNCIGTLTEAMEEGVFEGDVGPMQWSFEGARLGLIGGMTGHTLRKRRGLLYESGFLDRCSVLPWALPDSERKDILNRITHGDRSDLEAIHLPIPEEAIVIDLPTKVGEWLKGYVWEQWPDESLRLLVRFRMLTMSAAALAGRDVCKSEDVDKAVVQFSDYWTRCILTPAAEDQD
jgi:hypothetical protein